MVNKNKSYKKGFKMAQKVDSRTPLINDAGNQEGCCSLSSIVSKILQALKRLCCCCCSVDDVDPVVHHVPSEAMPRGQSVIGQAEDLPRSVLVRKKRSVSKPSFYPMDIMNYREYRRETTSSFRYAPEEMLEGIHGSLKSLTEEEMIGKNFDLYHFKREFGTRKVLKEFSPEEMHSEIIGQVNHDLPRQHVVINGRVFRGNGKNAEEVEQLLRPASGSLPKTNLILTLIQQGIYGGFTNKLFSFPVGKEEGFAVREAGEIPPALREMKVFINTEKEPIEIKMEKLFKFVNEDGETLAFVNIEISFQIPQNDDPIQCQWRITPIECESQFRAWEKDFPELTS